MVRVKIRTIRLMSRVSRPTFGMSSLSWPKIGRSRLSRPKFGVSGLSRPQWFVNYLFYCFKYQSITSYSTNLDIFYRHYNLCHSLFNFLQHSRFVKMIPKTKFNCFPSLAASALVWKFAPPPPCLRSLRGIFSWSRRFRLSLKNCAVSTLAQKSRRIHLVCKELFLGRAVSALVAKKPGCGP